MLCPRHNTLSWSSLACSCTDCDPSPVVAVVEDGGEGRRECQLDVHVID